MFLRIGSYKGLYNFYYKTSEKSEWILLVDKVDASVLSTKEAKGFVGTYLDILPH
ncbi:hypothetical protein [Mariniflexile sp. HMF6888]|uniref:hypothetical protein n=1 Tax=Mariniflexile sp. HMF6888 TaxID=3373086 RepID=UPI00378CBC31